jgi:hypothetical protein
VGELFIFGKSYYRKEAEDSGNFSSIMALRLANAPKIMVTDRWYGKTRQLRRTGVRKVLVLRRFNLGWPRGVRLRGTQLT